MKVQVCWNPQSLLKPGRSCGHVGEVCKGVEHGGEVQQPLAFYSNQVATSNATCGRRDGAQHEEVREAGAIRVECPSNSFHDYLYLIGSSCMSAGHALDCVIISKCHRGLGTTNSHIQSADFATKALPSDGDRSPTETL